MLTIDDYRSTREAAKALDTSLRNVQAAITRGAMQAEWRFGIWLITLEEIERYRRVSLGKWGKKSQAPARDDHGTHHDGGEDYDDGAV